MPDKLSIYDINKINSEDDITKIADVIIYNALEKIAIDNYRNCDSGISDFLHAMKQIPNLLCTNTDNEQIDRLINKMNQNLHDIKILLDEYLNSVNYNREKDSTSNEENKYPTSLINNKDIINIEDTPCPKWVKKNINLGSFGETLAEKYLKDHYKKVDRVSLVNDSLGYDIEADNKKFEVKTSISNLIAFHFTNNQLKVAKDVPYNYYLFYIYVNKKNAQSYGFMINDPIEVLNLHNYNTSNISDSNEVIALSDGLFIQPNKNYITKNSVVVNLNNYLFG